MNNPIQVLIADDHTLFREGMVAILANVPDIEVIGEAGTGAETIAEAQKLAPDVILMDINMPDMNGIEATQQVLAGQPETGVIILTMLEDDDSLFAAMRAGARGYILKGADKAEVLKTVRAVANGEALFGPAIARRLATYFSAPRPTAPALAFPELTEREREILKLIAQHLTNPEISRRLQISEKTVRNHASNIFAKLQVAGRAEAIIRARDAGLG